MHKEKERVKLTDFNYKALKVNKSTGRRFGKSSIVFELLLLAYHDSKHLGEIFFGYMSKKNQVKLNITFENYIKEQCCSKDVA